uniref:Uncharacterized protein n=1 Tax=Arundo donax TaxID=35708 RepID=A0A0A8XZY8_ARUDO
MGNQTCTAPAMWCSSSSNQKCTVCLYLLISRKFENFTYETHPDRP